MNRRFRLILALGIVMVLSTFMLYTALAGQDIQRPTIEAHELPARMGTARKRSVQLVGVAAGPISGTPGRKLSFFLTDRGGGNRIKVRYSGSVPDTFRVGRNIVLVGRLHGHGSNVRFDGQPGTLSTKCPSKFAADSPDARAAARDERR